MCWLCLSWMFGPYWVSSPHKPRSSSLFESTVKTAQLAASKKQELGGTCSPQGQEARQSNKEETVPQSPSTVYPGDLNRSSSPTVTSVAPSLHHTGASGKQSMPTVEERASEGEERGQAWLSVSHSGQCLPSSYVQLSHCVAYFAFQTSLSKVSLATTPQVGKKKKRQRRALIRTLFRLQGFQEYKSKHKGG